MIDCNFWVTPIEIQIGKLYKLAVCPWNWLSLTHKEEKQGWIPVSFPSPIILKKNDIWHCVPSFLVPHDVSSRAYLRNSLARKLISIGFRWLCLHSWNNICSFKSQTALGNNSPFSSYRHRFLPVLTQMVTCKLSANSNFSVSDNRLAMLHHSWRAPLKFQVNFHQECLVAMVFR